MSAILSLMLVEMKLSRRLRRRSGQRRRWFTIAVVAILAGLVFVASSPASGQRPTLSLVALTPGNIHVHNGGEFAIGVVCHATRGRCQGRVVLAPARHARNHTALATRTITLPAGRTTAVTLALMRSARRELARNRRLQATIVIRVRDRAHQLARLTARRVLVHGAPIGCWPRGAGSYPRWSWATARLFEYSIGEHNARDFGCLFRLDRAVQLLDPGARHSMFATLTDPRWDPVPFADPYVAGVIQGFFPQRRGPFWDVASWDLRTGRRVHRDRLGTGAKQQVGLAVSATDGALASIYGSEPQAGFGDLMPFGDVYAHDADGRRLIDSGTGVIVSSLRISGAVVSWTHDGQTRTAMLR